MLDTNPASADLLGLFHFQGSPAPESELGGFFFCFVCVCVCCFFFKLEEKVTAYALLSISRPSLFPWPTEEKLMAA